MEKEQKLQIYQYDNFKIVVNFPTFKAAEQYATENNGELLEVGFTDGSDALIETNVGDLIKEQRPFKIDIAPEYTIISSDDERFQDYAEKVLEEMKKKENDVAPEDWIADHNIAAGDRIIILKDGEINTVTTKERIKYLMQGNLYEIAVKITD